MICVIGCVKNAIGVANLKGKPGTTIESHSGQYPLCKDHYNEIITGAWATVELEGWEVLPYAASNTLLT